jgi:hypothetical protein
MTEKELQDALSASADVLAKVLAALTARRFLATEKKLTAPMRAQFTKDALPDAVLELLVGTGFEAALLVLAECKYPGVTLFRCNPSEDLQ